MISNILTTIDKFKPFGIAEAHCDIPCKIYDPSAAQIAALSVIRFIDLINELGNDAEDIRISGHAQLSRLTRQKEIHANNVKEEVRVIWGDYFKQPQFEQFPGIHTLVHNIMLAASACKQTVNRQKGEHLLDLVNEFSEAFWNTKGIDTIKATCPYPPSEQVSYPKHG